MFAFRASAVTTVSTSGTGAFTVNAPAGVQQNDRLLLAILSSYNGQGQTGSIRAMTVSGFTQILHIPYGTNISNAELWVFERVAGASEPATYAGDTTGGEGENLGCGLVLAYSGIRPQATSAVAGDAGPQGGPAVAPALAAATGMSVCFWCFRAQYISEASTATTVPAGFTKRGIATSGAVVTIVGGDASIGGTLPSEPATMHTTGGDPGWQAAQIAPQPAGGGLTFWM